MTTPRFELTSHVRGFRGYQLNHRGDRLMHEQPVMGLIHALFALYFTRTVAPQPRISCLWYLRILCEGLLLYYCCSITIPMLWMAVPFYVAGLSLDPHPHVPPPIMRLPSRNDRILRHERELGEKHFLCSSCDHKQEQQQHLIRFVYPQL